MSFLLHWNPRAFPPEQLIFVRSAISLGCLLPLCRGEVHKYFRRDSKFLWIRSLAGAAALLCYYYTLQGTVSSNANFLFSSSPIFVGIFSWILFRERTTPTEAFGIGLIIFANVLLYIPNREAIPFWVWLVGIAGALFSSIAFLSLGAATKIYSSSLIVLGLSFVSILVSAAVPGQPWLIPRISDAPYLLAVSFLGLLSQITATLSFAHLKSAIATAIGRSSILFSGLLEFALAGYRPHPLAWVSYFIVLLGIYFSQQNSQRGAKVRLK